jgi:hypothetical protein
MDSWVRLTRARLRLARDDLHGALVDQSTALSAARTAKDPQVVYPCPHRFGLPAGGRRPAGRGRPSARRVHGEGTMLLLANCWSARS